MRKIAIIGFNPLETAGLREILNTVSDCVAITILHNGDRNMDRADGYVVTPEIFSEAPEFFMSKSVRTCIIYQGSAGEYREDVRPLRVSLNESYEEIANKIGLFADSIDASATSFELSNREKDVLRELASGKTNKEIAEALFISVNTVITHRKNISAKLGVKSASGLSLYALMNGII